MGASVPEPPAGDNCLKVFKADEAVMIQVHGLGNMFLAPTLQTFVEAELQAGFLSFLVDLRCCQGLDSTFMGTFIGLSMAVRKKFGWFCLVNVSDENRRLLKMLGIIHMVSIHDGELPAAEGQAATTLHPTTDPYARQKQIHGAHRLLMDADPANKERFGAFIKALEEELVDIPRILPPKPKGRGGEKPSGA